MIKTRVAMTREQHDRILALRSEGYTFSKIGEFVGVSRSTAYNVCKGLTTRPGNEPSRRRESFRHELEPRKPVPARPHAMPGITPSMLMGNGRRRIVF